MIIQIFLQKYFYFIQKFAKNYLEMLLELKQSMLLFVILIEMN